MNNALTQTFVTIVIQVAGAVGSSLVFLIVKRNGGSVVKLKVSLLKNRKLHKSELSGDRISRILVPSTNLSRVSKKCKGLLVAFLPNEKLEDNSTRVLSEAAKKPWCLGIILKQTIDYTIINQCVFMDNTLTLDRKSIPKRYPKIKASLQFVEFPTIDLHGYLNVNPTGPKPIVPHFAKAIRKQLTKVCCQSFGKKHNCDNDVRNDRGYIFLINVLLVVKLYRGRQ